MSKSDSNSQESTARFADYIILGTDSSGREHVADLKTQTVHIVDVDGGRSRRVIPDEKTVDDYVRAVADDGRGWADRRYGYNAADALSLALQP